MPDYLAERWNPDMCTYLSPWWWRTHWERTGLVDVERADVVENSGRDWLTWLEACDLVDRGFEPDAAMLRADQGRLLGFTRITAPPTLTCSQHVSDPPVRAPHDDRFWKRDRFSGVARGVACMSCERSENHVVRLALLGSCAGPSRP